MRAHNGVGKEIKNHGNIHEWTCGTNTKCMESGQKVDECPRDCVLDDYFPRCIRNDGRRNLGSLANRICPSHYVPSRLSDVRSHDHWHMEDSVRDRVVSTRIFAAQRM